VTFFGYEWINPRLGKQIKDITLKAAEPSGSNENAIIMLGLSITENSRGEQSTGNERQ